MIISLFGGFPISLAEGAEGFRFFDIAVFPFSRKAFSRSGFP